MHVPRQASNSRRTAICMSLLGVLAAGAWRRDHSLLIAGPLPSLCATALQPHLPKLTCSEPPPNLNDSVHPPHHQRPFLVSALDHRYVLCYLIDNVDGGGFTCRELPLNNTSSIVVDAFQAPKTVAQTARIETLSTKIPADICIHARNKPRAASCQSDRPRCRSEMPCWHGHQLKK